MPSLILVPLFFAIALGASFGSFANVFLHRYPQGLSLFDPPSHCPHCGHAVRWWHNVPVLGWCWLRGRCRDCGRPIGASYVLVELAFAAVPAAVILRFGFEPLSWAYAGFLEVLLLAALVDWQTQYLYDVITLPLGALGLGFSFAFPQLLGGRWQSPLSMAATWAGMTCLMHLGRWLFHREEAMGAGDVKLMAAAAGFLGFKGVLVALLLGAYMGLPMMAVYSWVKRTSFWKDPGPFGPALALGCGLAAWDLMGGAPRLAIWLGFGPV
jgi:leader peptidase (prepilin peptidase)/N-methyltransferase